MGENKPLRDDIMAYVPEGYHSVPENEPIYLDANISRRLKEKVFLYGLDLNSLIKLMLDQLDKIEGKEHARTEI